MEGKVRYPEMDTEDPKDSIRAVRKSSKSAFLDGLKDRGKINDRMGVVFYKKG